MTKAKVRKKGKSVKKKSEDDVLERLLTAREGLREIFFEREDLIDGGLVALLSKQHVFILGAPGTAKCYGVDTPILMYDGSIKKIQDIGIGELVMGDDSTPREVLDTTSGIDDLFKVVPVKGDSFVVNKEHTLSLVRSGRAIFSHNEFIGYRDKERIFNIPVKEFVSMPNQIRYKLYRTGVDFQEKKVKIDPYILGVWLGDGNARDVRITSFDKKIIAEIQRYADELGLEVSISKKGKYAITSGYLGNSYKPSLQRIFRECNLLENKHIPDEYKYNSRSVRLELLAGLIDSDGTKDSRYDGVSYTCSDERLMDDVIYLCRSLGFAVYKKANRTTCNGKKFDSFRTYISGDCSVIPMRVERKKCKPRKQIKNHQLTGFKLEKIGRGTFYGFSLNENQLHLLGDFTVSHNSALTRAMVKMFNTSYFDYLLTKYTVPEELFGMVSLKRLEEDVHERRTENMLPEVEVAFLDEIWKANSSILNALLTITNERLFHNNGIQETPLISLWGCSNELPEGSELNALYDRFLLRFEVDYLKDEKSFLSMLDLNGTEPPDILSRKDLKALHGMVDDIPVDKGIKKKLAELRMLLRMDAGLTFSDRRWCDSISVLKAAALLEAKDEVENSDLTILAHVMWDRPEDRKKVARLVTQTCDPIGLKCLEWDDLAVEIHKNAMEANTTEAGFEATTKLKEMMREIDKEQKTAKVKKVRDRIEKLNSEVIEKCLGLSVSDEDV